MLDQDQQMLLNRFLTYPTNIPNHIQGYFDDVEEGYIETISDLEEDVDTLEKEHAIDMDNKNLEIEGLKDRIKELEAEIERLKQDELV